MPYTYIYIILPQAILAKHGRNLDACVCLTLAPRRGRLMRQIREVHSTEDGLHTLILCSDGAVLYHPSSTASESAPLSAAPSGSSDEQSSSAQEMVEVPALSVDVDPEKESAWALRRVGRSGLVVLLRGYRSSALDRPIISVKPLSGESVSATLICDGP